MSTPPPQPTKPPTRKHRIEHAALSGICYILRVLPYKAGLGLMTVLAAIAHFVFGWRKEMARERIRQVRSDLAEKEVRTTAWLSWRNLCFNAVETVRMPKLTPEWVDDHVDAGSCFEDLSRETKANPGVILVIPHCGNWDLAGVVCGLKGIKSAFIARKQKNELTYKLLMEMREELDGVVLDRDDPALIKKITSELHAHKMVAILVDLRARTPGRTYDLFGHKAWLTNGLGLMASRSGAAVVPAFLHREGKDKHVWRLGEFKTLADFGKGKPAREALFQWCLDEISPHVLRHPESYFWVNKRWVLEPFEDE